MNRDNDIVKEEKMEDIKPSVGDQNADLETQVNPILLDTLIEMGIRKHLAKKALVHTKNRSAEVALTWIAELGAEEMEELCRRSDNESSDDNWEDCDDEEEGEEEDEEEEEEIYYKMVFVVNTELNMGVGKVASQVGHAALGLYRVLLEDKEKYESSVEEWEEFGERKITLRGKNTQELIELQNKAESLHLPTYLVQDAGKTQIPSGSTTVLAIFGDEEAVNEVTGKLKLL